MQVLHLHYPPNSVFYYLYTVIFFISISSFKKILCVHFYFGFSILVVVALYCR